MSVTFYGSFQEIGSRNMTYIRGLEGPNWTYGNAKLLLDLLGLPYDTADGVTGVVHISDARRAAIRGANACDKRVRSATRPVTITKRYIECGLDEEGIRYRVNAFVEFVEKAWQMGARSIYWA